MDELANANKVDRQTFKPKVNVCNKVRTGVKPIPINGGFPKN